MGQVTKFATDPIALSPLFAMLTVCAALRAIHRRAKSIARRGCYLGGHPSTECPGRSLGSPEPHKSKRPKFVQPRAWESAQVNGGTGVRPGHPIEGDALADLYRSLQVPKLQSERAPHGRQGVRSPCRSVYLAPLLLLASCELFPRFPQPVETDNTKKICAAYPTHLGHYACLPRFPDLQVTFPEICDAWARVILECQQYKTNCDAAANPPQWKLKACSY